MKQQQGQQANSNGCALESQVQARIISAGYREMTKKEIILLMDIGSAPQFPVFTRQFKYFTGVYGTPIKVDFFIWNPTKEKMFLIECKYQETPGSVDEKLVYTVESLVQTGVPSILIIIGNGFRRTAINWCLHQADEKLFVFDDFSTFLKAANKGMI